MVINNKNNDLLSRIVWAVLGQECLERSDEEMPMGCVGMGVANSGVKLQRVDSGDFLHPSFAKRKQKILYFAFKVSSLR